MDYSQLVDYDGEGKCKVVLLVDRKEDSRSDLKSPRSDRVTSEFEDLR